MCKFNHYYNLIKEGERSDFYGMNRSDASKIAIINLKSNFTFCVVDRKGGYYG